MIEGFMERTSNLQCTHVMTEKTMADFILHAKELGLSAVQIRKFSCAVRSLYEFLSDDKTLTKDLLLSWRKHLENKGYAPATVQNYIKYINRYLNYVGCSEIRFNRGKPKDITGMTFGYLTAIQPTEKKNRNNIVWLCKCKCGKIVERPATRLLTGNTLSCGCVKMETLGKANMYIDNTSLRQVFNDKAESEFASSGYVGVTKKRNKWQAYINYKGKRHFLGCYENLEDAVEARAKAKQLTQEDAARLLNLYAENHKLDLALPSGLTEPKREFSTQTSLEQQQDDVVAKRSNNKS